jgi:hypothetical protein
MLEWIAHGRSPGLIQCTGCGTLTRCGDKDTVSLVAHSLNQIGGPAPPIEAMRSALNMEVGSHCVASLKSRDWSLSSLKEKLIKIGAQDHQPGPQHCLPDGGGRHSPAIVQRGFAADCGAAADAVARHRWSCVQRHPMDPRCRGKPDNSSPGMPLWDRIARYQPQTGRETQKIATICPKFGEPRFESVGRRTPMSRFPMIVYGSRPAF